MTDKTLPDLQAELAILTAELAECNRLAAERATCSYQVQTMQTQVLLGHKTKADLAEAQAQLDATVDALTRRPMLEQAVRDHKELIQSVQHRERKDMIEGIRTEFIDVMARYKVESAKLLEIHKHLVAIDNRFRGLARSPIDGLLDPFYRELNLPAVTGPLASRSNFTTGQEL